MKGLKTYKLPKEAKMPKSPKLPKAPKLPSVSSAMRAPTHLSGGKAMQAPKVGGKVPTLNDFKRKIPKGGLSNKGLRSSYGKVPGLDI